jgi:hypothetical protein
LGLFTIERAEPACAVAREHASLLQQRLSLAARSRIPPDRSGDQAMFTAAFKWVSVVLVVLGCQSPGALAQQAPGVADRLHADAVASFRQARFPEAYARFIRLADAGHAPSAEVALWMYLHGPSLFGRDWDSTQDQLTAWAQLAHQPVPTMVARIYPRTLVPFASRER